MNINEYKEMHGNDDYESEITSCSECGNDWDRIYCLDGKYYCAECFEERCYAGDIEGLESEIACCICGEPIKDGRVFCFDEVPTDDNLMDEECFWNTANEEYLVN